MIGILLWLSNERYSVHNCRKRLYIHILIVPVYLQACTVLKNHPATVIITEVDVELLCSIFSVVCNLSERYLALVESHIVDLDPLIETVLKGNWRTNFDVEGAKLFY